MELVGEDKGAISFLFSSFPSFSAAPDWVGSGLHLSFPGKGQGIKLVYCDRLGSMTTTGWAWRNFHLKTKIATSEIFFVCFSGVKCGWGFLARKLGDVDEKKDRLWNMNVSPR